MVKLPLFQYPLVDWGDGDLLILPIVVPMNYFSILWWIGVMETTPVCQPGWLSKLFQYPLVDWGDGDPCAR